MSEDAYTCILRKRCLRPTTTIKKTCLDEGERAAVHVEEHAHGVARAEVGAVERLGPVRLGGWFVFSGVLCVV